MKYFAKYITVEGEVGDGDFFIDMRAPNLRIAPGVAMKCIIDIEGEARNHAKKVKLFLCSRDIQVGDRYYNVEENIFNTVSSEENLVQIKYEKHLRTRIKVIGEISPAAIWVKEGDEFDTKDWAYPDEWKENTIPTIQIMCPTCKNFH